MKNINKDINEHMLHWGRSPYSLRSTPLGGLSYPFAFTREDTRFVYFSFAMVHNTLNDMASQSIRTVKITQTFVEP